MKSDSSHSGGWKMPALWIAPWAFYLSIVVLTVAAANLSGRGFAWLHPLERNEVLRILAVVVVLFWISARITAAIKSQWRWIIAALVVIELPLAFLVYLFWAVGMIGGPINPG